MAAAGPNGAREIVVDGEKAQIVVRVQESKTYPVTGTLRRFDLPVLSFINRHTDLFVLVSSITSRIAFLRNVSNWVSSLKCVLFC
jgi:hypothetical protein